MIKYFQFLVFIFVFQVQPQSLNEVFENCLISDNQNNIERSDPILITQSDEVRKRIKTNYKRLENLISTDAQQHKWYITQGEEASTIVSIENIDLESGWISLGETHAGVFNMDQDETLEFFNPFLNYSIIKNGPLLKPYPSHVNEEYINYIQAGGIIKRAENDYVLLLPTVFGAHESRAIYYATSTDLENWSFIPRKILGTETISFAKKSGNVFSTGNPLLLDDGNYLVLLGVEQPNGNYTSAYMILNERLEIVQEPQEIKIPDWHGLRQNSFPLAVTKHDDLYRVLLHRRSNRFIESEIHEITTSNILKTFANNENVLSSKMIHQAKNESGYLRGKADDASYINYNSKLYIILGSEESPSEYLTSLNREYGLLSLEDGIWVHDQRSPLIVNPVNFHDVDPEYDWASDHLGGYVSPIFHEEYLYLFLTFGTDNPDYLLSGIKIKVD